LKAKKRDDTVGQSVFFFEEKRERKRERKRAKERERER